ncbi:helix-turn-helix transcriptional regulator [Falsirhodobacter xinxiangensis]|uniref:helix-turn-helix transcriptional regulator n=1 Tax=Falsirhodobacter xinxiangensis TaxID=2530049 RepID=UPI0010A9E709|nr:LuxR family transcriptional regulator [Rhodobacter xinxiangensis]
MPKSANQLDEAARLSPVGFYIALHVGFSFPQEEVNRLPLPWVEYYTIHGLGVHDPVMRWFYSSPGSIIRWSAIDIADPRGVMAAAHEHGLIHGAAATITGLAGRRSYANFFRDDRPFTDDELEQLFTILSHLHDGDLEDVSLTPAEVEALRMQSEGKRLKQIAWELGISVSAVKARLASAKRKLGAQTASQAAVLATARRIF